MISAVQGRSSGRPRVAAAGGGQGGVGLDQTIAAVGAARQGEGVVEAAAGSEGLEVDAVVGDVDHLIQFGIFGGAHRLGVGAVVDAVHLRADDRDQIDRADRLARVG